MMAALYARVSTIGKGQDLDVQLRELRREAERRQWKSTEFSDQISGTASARPSLDLLWKKVRAGEIDAVVVQRFDRFARSVRQLIDAMQEFNERNIRFVSLHEGVDTTTPNGRLQFHIFAAIAEFERELIRERVRAGLENARAKGKVFGRPKSEYLPATIDYVAQQRLKGASWVTISAATGIHPSSLRRMVSSLVKSPQKEGSASD